MKNIWKNIMKKISLGKLFIIIFLSVYLWSFCDTGYNFYKEYNNIDWQEYVSSKLEDAPEEIIDKYNVTDKNNPPQELINYVKTNTLFIAIIYTFVGALLITIIRPFFIWIIFLGIYLANRKYYRNKLSTNDFNKEKIYYRDILKEYSLDVLAYIDNFKLDLKSVLTAMLLNLEHKKIITLKNNKITILNHDVVCSSTEKYCLDNIKNGKLNIKNIDEYQNIIIDEAIKDGLLKSSSIKINNLAKKFFFAFVLTGILMYLIPILFVSGLSNLIATNLYLGIILMILLFLIVLASFFYPFILIVYSVTYFTKMSRNPYKRTKKGEDINKKLEGLKKYLIDYSNLDERDKKEIEVWEEYLIYSVLFKQNNKIIEEYSNFITN